MRHLAIICDGNRRWARANGLPPEAGHAQGLTAIERCCGWAIERGVYYLTVFCFSTENWRRSVGEVDAIMDLAREYFARQKGWYVQRGIRVRFRGRRDRVAGNLVEAMADMEAATAECETLMLNICVDYGGRDEIARAVEAGARTEEELDAALMWAPEPDVILRTGGQKRLSGFLLWQGAYSELVFSKVMFPALEAKELDRVAAEFERRTRNFGR